jgi:hypothetical protein
MNADFQTIQYSFIASKNTYALRINFTAPVFHGFSPSQQKLKKCSHERRVIYILRKYYVKKVAHFYRPVISARYKASCAGLASVTEVQEPAML